MDKIDNYLLYCLNAMLVVITRKIEEKSTNINKYVILKENLISALSDFKKWKRL